MLGMPEGGGGVGKGWEGWGRVGGVGKGGEGWGGVDAGIISDVNSKCAHATTIGIYSMFDAFAWVRQVPPLPFSSSALDSPPLTFKGT